MACSCHSSEPTVIFGADGITVVGSGTANDPYRVTLESGLVTIQANDTQTVNLSLVGSGTADDPFRLSAVATVRMADLTDVSDPAGPSLGDVPVYDGSKWIFDAPPTVPPGEVNVGAGLDGDGTLGDPITLKVSNLIETSTSGLETYIDSAGELRAVPPAASAPTWASITGKPTTFPPIVGTGATQAKAGNWLPSFAEVGSGIYISLTEPPGVPENAIWLEPPV